MPSRTKGGQVKVYDQLTDMYEAIKKYARKSKNGVSKLHISGLNGGTTIGRVLQDIKPNLAQGYSIKLMAWDPRVDRINPMESKISAPVFREIMRLQRALDSQNLYDPTIRCNSFSELVCEYLMIGSRILATPGRQTDFIHKIEDTLALNFPAVDVERKNGSILTRLSPHYVPGVVVIMDNHVFARIYTYGGKNEISLETTADNKLYSLLDQHQTDIWDLATEMGARPIGRDAKAEEEYFETVVFPTATLPEARIFINYRKADTGWAASRLFDHLKMHFGQDNVFLDHKTIDNATVFETEIMRSLTASEVFIAFIGPIWSSISTESGERRLFEDDDFVRREIELALEQNKKILLVSVDGASLPTADELPASIKHLSGLQSNLTLSFETFLEDARKICDAIEKAVQ